MLAVCTIIWLYNTYDNKSVLLSHCSHAYNGIAILIQNVIEKVNKLAFKTKILNLTTSKIITDKKLNKICNNLISTKLTTILHNTKFYNSLKSKHTLQLASLLSTE